MTTPESNETDANDTSANDANTNASANDTNTTAHVPTSPRPLGYWLRVIDRRLDERMRELFQAEGLTRRDWRRLNLIGGAVADARMTERLAAHPGKVAPLVERGWVEGEPGGWRLTEAGVAARESLHERVSSLRAEVAGSVSPEDFATTMASLEAIARTLGWNEDERMPRGPRRGIRRHQGEHPHPHGGHWGRRGHGHPGHHGGQHPCGEQRRAEHHHGGEHDHGGEHHGAEHHGDHHRGERPSSAA